MPPNRSKSAKPGGLRLPGTFAPADAPPAANPSPRRATTAKASPSSKPLRKLPGTAPTTRVSSVPASRLSSKSTAQTTSTPNGLISSFGSGASSGGSGRFERVKSDSPAKSPAGQNRLERLGLNRASLRRSPSPEESGSDHASSEGEQRRYMRGRERPKASWDRGSSDEEEARPNLSTRRQSSHARVTSPSLHHASRSRSASSGSVPPTHDAQLEEDHRPSAEAKGTLLGSLWSKAATAWSGSGNTEAALPATAPRRVQEEEARESERERREANQGREKPSSASEHDKVIPAHAADPKTAEPVLKPVEPITYHRPPSLHPRNILLASADRKFRHDDAYDWLGDEAKSPVDAYLFHRQAGRMATKKVRLKRPPPHGMATAPAILSGIAFAGGAPANVFPHPNNSGVPFSGSGQHSTGVFVSKESMGPVRAFSQAAPPPAVAAPHPGPPPVPPPIPPGYRTPTSVPLPAGTSPGVSLAGQGAGATALAAASPQVASSRPSMPNPNALPSFPAPASLGTSGGPATVAQAPFQSQGLVAPRQPVVPTAYAYVGSAAPLTVPAPVFTAPATGLPTSISTEAPLGDAFKSALAKKLFGNQLSDAPPRPVAPSTAAALPFGAYPLPPYPFAPILHAQLPGAAQQVQASSEPRLPTPAASIDPPSSQPPQPTQPSAVGDNAAPPVASDHGALPPMPIPQSITPPPLPNSISFAPTRPLSGLGGWIIPASTTSPLWTPEPSFASGSPAPSSSVSQSDGPSRSTTPMAVQSRRTSSEEEVREDGERANEAIKELANSDTLTPRASSPLQPTRSSSTTLTESEDSASPTTGHLAVANQAALSVPLPPSPAPSSSSIIPRSEAEASNDLADPASPTAFTSLPALTTSSCAGEPALLLSSSKELPPPPAASPALPPLPPAADFSVLLPDIPDPVGSPQLPPLPPDSPCPVVPPRPVSVLSPEVVSSHTSQSTPEVPARPPSLAISMDSVSSPKDVANLDVAAITLQPPTPIERTAMTSTVNEDDFNKDNTALELPALSLDLDLDSTPLTFDFESLDFSTPSIVPELPDTQTYFSSLGLNFGGQEDTQGQDGPSRGVERDDQGRLELPVLREENLFDDVQIEFEYDDEGDTAQDNMSDQFDAATSFVSGFRETDLARARVDPGHTERTERWLEGQGLRRSSGLASLTEPIDANKDKPDATVDGQADSTIFRPRTAPPSSIPPSSIAPSPLTLTQTTRSRAPSFSILRLATGPEILPTLEECDDGAPSPMETMINFAKPSSSVHRGRVISSTGSRDPSSSRQPEEEESRRRALNALSNQAFLV